MAVILLATLCALVVLFSGRLPCQSNAYGMFCYAMTALGEGRQAFFSEEKKQKTFTSLSRFSPAAHAKDAKVFWFFFAKKNCFLA